MTDVYRHKKRGSTYTVVGLAEVQADEPLTDYEVVTVYRCRETGRLWVRRKAEFEDGRFEILSVTADKEQTASIQPASRHRARP